VNRDIYQEVTDRIIEELEKGVVPWQSPYFSEIGFPKNFASGKEYRGINVFLLASQRYTSPWFLTFLQARELGGHVRKGERGSLVIKYGTYRAEEAQEDQPDETKRRGYLKGYTVFNASQIDGIAFPEVEGLAAFSPSAACDRARAIVAGMPKAPPISEGAAIPHYRPATDSIHMPERKLFTSEAAFFSTLFHELTHASGHISRLARKTLLESKGIDATGEARKVYAEEELVAEMGASFLNAHAGIMEGELPNSAAYLQGWIEALKSKDAKHWIIRAASQAQKAADFILNITSEADAV
jgi:antirestriction protein ArdC